MVLESILDFFRTFPVATRDQLVKLFYGKVTDTSIRNINSKLRKLVDRQQVEVCKEFRPYVYFAVPRRIHRISNHLRHHLALVDFYMWLKERGETKVKGIEVNFGKDLPRPDIIVEWKGKLHMVELQRSIITEAKMRQKIEQYRKLRESGQYKEYGNDFLLWIISPKVYDIEDAWVVQTNSINAGIKL